MKKFVIAMACLALVVAGALTIVLVMNLSGSGGLGFSNWGEPPLVNRQVFSAGDFDALSLAYSSESITLLPSSGDEIVLEEYMSRDDAKYHASINQNGGSLTIHQGARPTIQLNFLGSGWRAKVKLYVPSEWLAALELKTSSGSIRSEYDFSFAGFSAEASSGSVRVEDITATNGISLRATSGSVAGSNLSAGGDISLTASSGSVRADDARAAGELSAEATSGSVRLGRAEGDKVNLNSSSGSIHVDELVGAFTAKNTSGGIDLEDVTGHGSAKTSSGSLKVSVDELTGDLSCESTSGSVRAELPRDAAFTVEANTSSGSINLPSGNTTYNQKKNQASGSFGDDPTHEVELRASSGSVRLEWN